MIVITNGYISLKNIYWDLIVCAYLIISLDASLEPVIKGNSLLFILTIYLLLNSTVMVLECTRLCVHVNTLLVVIVLMIESTSIESIEN